MPTAPPGALLTLSRKGTFTVGSTLDDRTQCGQQGMRRFYYRVEITCRDSGLDEQGFIVDQLTIHDWMVEHHRNMPQLPSCERLALEAARGLARLCKELVRVRVSIGGKKNAYMTAEYTG